MAYGLKTVLILGIRLETENGIPELTRQNQNVQIQMPTERHNPNVQKMTGHKPLGILSLDISEKAVPGIWWKPDVFGSLFPPFCLNHDLQD